MSTPIQSIKDSLASQAGDIVSNLFLAHFDAFGEEMSKSETNKLSVSVGFKLRQTSGGINLKAKISFGAKTTDEAEVEVSDPRQEKLGL